jgi:hypothetical protein
VRLVDISAIAVGEAETQVSATSILSGKEHVMTLPIDIEDFTEGMARWGKGTLIQLAFPDLTDEQREFLMTGTTQQEWDIEFPPEEEEKGE